MDIRQAFQRVVWGESNVARLFLSCEELSIQLARASGNAVVADSVAASVCACVSPPIVEQQREDELLVVPRINRPPQEHGGSPEVGFEVLLGDASRRELNTERNTK